MRQEIFAPGEAITVKLTAELELHGEHQQHPAKFVRYHAVGDWAEVELEEEHAGQTRRLHVPLYVINQE